MCEIAHKLIPGVDCYIFWVVVIAGTFILVSLLMMWLIKSSETIAEGSLEKTKAEEEDEDSYYRVEVKLNMKDGNVIHIYCDGIDSKSFSGGSVSFHWDSYGSILIEDDKEEIRLLFDSDEETIEWGIDEVKTWEITGA